MRSLNIKLTYRCTNQCRFCFSSHLSGEKISIASMLSAVRQGYERGCQAVVLSGGEPTLYPDCIETILLYAKRLGYRHFTIQSNGSGMSEKNALFYFLRDFSNEAEVAVSFSVHGSNSVMHDGLCSTSGAFFHVINALENVSSGLACRLFTNTVISSVNIASLKEIAVLLAHFNPAVIQFSVMHTASCGGLATGLADSARAIRSLSGVVERGVLRSEGVPYCLMYGLEECVGESYWPDKLDLFNKNDRYLDDFNQLESGMRQKADFCPECIMDTICAGVWAEHRGELIANARPIH